MTTDELQKQIERLLDKIYWLEARLEILSKRDREQRKWIIKLTNKNHPARRIAK